MHFLDYSQHKDSPSIRVQAVSESADKEVRRCSFEHLLSGFFQGEMEIRFKSLVSTMCTFLYDNVWQLERMCALLLLLSWHVVANEDA